MAAEYVAKGAFTCEAPCCLELEISRDDRIESLKTFPTIDLSSTSGI